MIYSSIELQDYKIFHDRNVYGFHSICVLVLWDLRAYIVQINGFDIEHVLWFEIDENLLLYSEN